MNSDFTTLKKPDKKKSDLEAQKWTPEQEELLAEWSEKATCYRWLHSRSEKRYRCRNYTFTIPVIILSTLTGTANFAMDSFVPEENKQLAMAAVGSVNIFAGILSTLQNFLRYAELMESHRLSEVQWSKFGRNISVELALDPKRRKPANDFLKVCRAEFDRLIEQSPTIDDPIVNQFKSAFKGLDVHKPDMCNGIKKCKIFVPSEEDKKINMIAEVGSKLIEKSHHKTWKPVKTTNSPKKGEISFKNESTPRKENNSKKELEGLKNIGRVSSFKKVTVSNNKDETPIETIHEIVKLNNKLNADKPKDEIKDIEVKQEKPKQEIKDIEMGIMNKGILDEKLFLDGIQDIKGKENVDIQIDEKEDGEDGEDIDNKEKDEEVGGDVCDNNACDIDDIHLCDNCENKLD